MLRKMLEEVVFVKQVFEKGVKQEQKMINFLKQKIPMLKEDVKGNLYFINKDTPLICAHMDTVGDALDQAQLKKMVDNNGVWSCGGITGFDDKAGITIALAMYKKLGNKISLLFTVEEESGGMGARHFVSTNKELLDQCTYCLIADRKGAHDIIGESNGYCTQNFEDKIVETISSYGYKPAHGLFSDADNINKVLCCVNLSCGYYNAHTELENLKFSEFNNCFEAMCHIVETVKEKFVAPDPISYGCYAKFNYYDTTQYCWGTPSTNKSPHYNPGLSSLDKLFSNTEYKHFKQPLDFFEFNGDNIITIPAGRHRMKPGCVEWVIVDEMVRVTRPLAVRNIDTNVIIEIPVGIYEIFEYNEEMYINEKEDIEELPTTSICPECYSTMVGDTCDMCLWNSYD